MAAGPEKDWIRSFRALKNLNLPVGPGAALCLARDSLPLDRETAAVPAGWI